MYQNVVILLSKTHDYININNINNYELIPNSDSTAVSSQNIYYQLNCLLCMLTKASNCRLSETRLNAGNAICIPLASNTMY